MYDWENCFTIPSLLKKVNLLLKNHTGLILISRFSFQVVETGAVMIIESIS
jgi:hypothetical protein